MTISLKILIAILWIPFTYWTVRYFRKLRNLSSGEIIYRRGVLGFGIPSWLLEVVIALTVMPHGDVYSMSYWAVVLLYFLFPVGLWCGYFWGKGMAAIFPGSHDRG